MHVSVNSWEKILNRELRSFTGTPDYAHASQMHNPGPSKVFAIYKAMEENQIEQSIKAGGTREVARS